MHRLRTSDRRKERVKLFFVLTSKEGLVETQDFCQGGAASASGLHHVVLGERQPVFVVCEVQILLSLADTVHMFSLTAAYMGIWSIEVLCNVQHIICKQS